jgi:UDP-glucose 4-epimerase
MKSILIIGVSGFIGSNFAEFYLRKGLMVTGFDFQIPPKTKNLQEFPKFSFIQGHWLDIAREVGISSYDTILFLGSPSTVSSVDNSPVDSFSSMCLDMIVFFEMLVSTNPTVKVVLPSSAAVYGEVASENAREELVLLPISLYGLFKKNMEDIANFYSRKHGISVAVIRFFSVYGPGLRKQLFWDAISKIEQSPKVVDFFGTGQERRDWIYVDDAIRLVDLILIRMARDSLFFLIVNAGTGVGITVDFALSYLIANASPDKRVSFSGNHKQGDPNSLVADTFLANSYGWKPKVSIEDGLIRYLNWYKDE